MKGSIYQIRTNFIQFIYFTLNVCLYTYRERFISIILEKFKHFIFKIIRFITCPLLYPPPFLGTNLVCLRVKLLELVWFWNFTELTYVYCKCFLNGSNHCTNLNKIIPNDEILCSFRRISVYFLDSDSLYVLNIFMCRAV